MNFLPLFFICIRMFHFIHAGRIYFLLQGFRQLMEERRRHPGEKQVLVVKGSASIFVIYFVCDTLYLLYCIWLMLHDATWTPGFLLIAIASLESFAVHLRISGTYTLDRNNFCYPRTWLLNLSFAESMFILLKLFEGV